MGKGHIRNQVCWCGSGKKYKKCHLGRESEESLKPWEAQTMLKKSFSKKYCSCPEKLKSQCSGQIVKAHTVSKSSSLKAIVRDGHIYGIVASIHSLIKSGGIYKPELIGIKNASTFTGFCSHHDSTLFSPFEDSPFKCTEEQLFLMAYRSFAREVYTKRSQIELLEKQKIFDKGKPIHQQQIIQQLIKLQSYGASLAEKDNQFHQTKFEELLIQKKYSTVKAFVVECDSVLPIACSGSFNPHYDFLGNEIQDFSDTTRPMDLVNLSVFTDNGKSYIAFIWLENSNESASKLISSLKSMDDRDIIQRIIPFIFLSMENIFMKPDWWESLSDDKRKKLENLTLIDANPMLPMSGEDMKSSEVYCENSVYRIKDKS